MDEADGLGDGRRVASRALAARRAPSHGESIEAPLRAAFTKAMQSGDLETARQSLRTLATKRHGPAVGLEERLWQVLGAYTVLLSGKPDRAMVRRSIRSTFIASGPAIATLDLQVWAKPRRLAVTLAQIGLSDMTCEGVILEMPKHFPADMVSRAQRFLAEHRSALPNRT